MSEVDSRGRTKEYRKKEYQKHRENYLRRSKEYHQSEHGKKVVSDWWQAKKRRVLSHYGLAGKAACIWCGYDDLRALSIDHIEGGGHEHRKNTKSYGSKIYAWLEKENMPEGFQTLCMNCQWIKRAENREHK